MQWILTIPEDFSLGGVIANSQRFILPPVSVHEPNQLARVERLESGITVLLNIAQLPAGLQLRVAERISAADAEELSHKTWRMLRLVENPEQALAQKKAASGNYQPPLQGLRILRGADLYEDMIKALILAQSPPTWGVQRIGWLVARLGDPLPSNPTLHAFPQPLQMLWNAQLILEVLGPEVGPEVNQICELFRKHEINLELLENPKCPQQEMIAYLHTLPGVNDTTLAYIMLALGRYDYRRGNANHENKVAAIQSPHRIEH